MSAAFDTVDHSVLLEILRRRFGIDGNALRWMAEFLNDRTYTVGVGNGETRCCGPE